MKVLFYFVHPSKFHLFKNTFKNLDRLNIEYDVVIANKDVLSKLLTDNNIKHFDIFPNGRKKSLPFFINAPFYLLLTLFRLYKITKKKKYDLFISDDVISFLGKITKTKTITFTDNDLETIPKLRSIFKYSDYILAPTSTKLEEFEYKKMGFRGPKAIAHLHPNYFKIDVQILSKYNLQNKKYCFIRVAKLNASHDLIGNPGITDQHLTELIDLLKNQYEIYLSSERNLNKELEKYTKKINPDDMTHILAGASLYIGDSTTMGIEAAVLGVPNIIINKVSLTSGILEEMKYKFGVTEYFPYYEDAKSTILEFIGNDNLKEEFKQKMNYFYENTDDFNEFLLNEILKFK